jgi:Caspase domain/PGAP1-like protein
MAGGDTRTVYSLLVGIDAYQAPVPALNGCVNDVVAIGDLLSQRVAGEGLRLEPMTLIDQQATRHEVIEGFRAHLGRARAGDIALFYYSGHGSQEAAPPEFWRFEPDRLDETLVCWDSRMPGRFDLADKELAQLIAEVAEPGPHVLVVLDCCHSGSGTRAGPEGGISIRRAPTDRRPRPLDSFIVSPEQVDRLTRHAGDASAAGWVDLAAGRHVLLAACRADETAKEIPEDGRARGALSAALQWVLTQTGEQLTYRDLHKWVSARVHARVAEQTPQLECASVEDYDRPFLGGAVRPRAQYFTLSFDPAEGWVIDAGEVHGIPPVAGSETTHFAAFGVDTGPAEWREATGTLATAAATTVLPDHTRVDAVVPAGAPQLDRARTYKAVITALPLAPLRVAFDGEADGVRLARQALASASPGGAASLIVSEVPRNPEVRLVALATGFRITGPAAERPLVADLTDPGPAGAAQAVARLEHIATWRRLHELQNPATRLGPNAVAMEVFEVSAREEMPGQPSPPGREIRTEYRRVGDRWRQPMLKVRLTNGSGERLYCALLDLTEDYGVAAGLLGRGGEWLEPGQTAWANDGNPLYGLVPKALWQQGITEFTDLLKLVVSTSEFDAALLAQPALDLPFDRGVRAVASPPRNTLERLSRRVQTRSLGTEPEDDEPIPDWVTSQVDIVTIRPLDAVAVPRDGDAALAAGVTVLAHPALTAAARLDTLPSAARDLSVPSLPPLLRDDPATSQPFQFATTRGSAPALTVLVLSEVENWQAVTPEQPLVLHVDQLVADGEHVLPVAWDGEFYLPLGRAQPGAGGSTEIILEQLVQPVATARDLRGSIRILFRKIIGQRLGLGYDYPLLTHATVADDGTVAYERDGNAIRAAVTSADRILLYVHGIIGDTRGMVSSSRPEHLALGAFVEPVGTRYQLLLAFDYENINTPIDETARDLKSRLATVGLGERHGKTLDVVAHSMGGLVTRWMIERENGDTIVNRLVTLGTPNGGSPWATLETWATTLLALGLNGLAGAFWPAGILAGLLAALEKVDVALDQMTPQSEFLTKLAASPDPHRPYQVIVGNRSLVASVADDQRERLARLLGRLSPRRAVDAAVTGAFLGQPNDLAVSVGSARNLVLDRTPAPVFHEIACDHMTFFSTMPGLIALAEALA